MKKNIKIYLVLLTFTIASCSSDEEAEQSCVCVTTYYTIEPGTSGYTWYGTVPAPELDCDDAMPNKVTTGEGNRFYQVTCE
jgi:hypothetical protein